ncbi:innexin-11-like [Octopus sinensis]|uniref:Innexin n=1 Tax=Octopus sinensis TaxID=2607531 RepID=A0A6P7TZC6_9MOLL|nr:innexin-11-like [Octopus sinensis]XP_029657673.1 innexin-11-like [Octopus sinensis]
MNQQIPETNFYEGKPQLRYYQWAPFIFIVFAFMCQLPRLFWRSNNETCGLNLQNVIEIGEIYHNAEEREKRDDQIKLITIHFNRYFNFKNRQKKGFNIFWTKSLTMTYLFTKLLYSLNAVAQFLITDLLLSNGKLKLYGITLLRNLITGASPDSGFFPGQTLCDFNVRKIGMEKFGQNYTAQCVLSVNFYLQAIFSFYWFWLVFVIFYNCSNTSYWMYHLLSKTNSRYYVRKHIRRELFLNSQSQENCNEKEMMNNFINQYLKTDGIFALRLMSKNVSDIVLTDFISALYENYKIMEIAKKTESSSIL